MVLNGRGQVDCNKMKVTLGVIMNFGNNEISGAGVSKG